MLASTTALIVAHRPSTVMLADRVALLEDGRVTAVGTHSQLLRENGHYAYVISSLEDEEKREAAQASDRITTDAAASAMAADRPAGTELGVGATTGIEPIAREEATR